MMALPGAGLPPNVLSRLPLAFRRTRLKSLLPFKLRPATMILPSGWTVTLRPSSSLPPTGMMALPVPWTGAKVGASFTAVTVMLAVSLSKLKNSTPGVVTT
ncbi:hypothetical protein EEB15_27705 [Ramlibacter sp. WS9]|nr:hypothetical protein EEB15_27705 [Ramlibacter sp. WS9]